VTYSTARNLTQEQAVSEEFFRYERIDSSRLKCYHVLLPFITTFLHSENT
jgi:hypothetical protein